ncbi:MAG TPA: ABC transporter permease [Elusimicrobia bacterium]|nr:ABC transporter permease [Elusimicrobiota bacterium]
MPPEPPPDSGAIIRRLIPYVAPYRLRFLQAALCMVLVSVFNGATVWLLKPVVDKVFIQRDIAMLKTLLFLVPLVFFCKMVLNFTQVYLMCWISQRATRAIRADLFRHLHGLSMDFFWKSRSGEVLSRVTSDLTNVQSALQFTPLYLIREGFTALVLLTSLFVLNWRFACLSAVALPIAGVVLYVTGRKMRMATRRGQEIMGDLYHRFQESIQGMLVVKAFNYEAGAIAKFDRENAAFFDQMMRYLRAAALSGPLMEFLGSLVLTLVLYYGGREIMDQRMSPGDFMVFFGCMFAAYTPIKNLANLNSEFQRGAASALRIFVVLDEKATVVESPAPRPFAKLEKGLVFEKVSFRYPGRDAWALKGVDLSVAPGEVVAVAGSSGSGKTTLAHLLLRLFDPEEGRILVDGIDLREYSIASLRRAIGLVTQDTILLHDTVMGNVAIGCPDASQERILAALRAADAADFVARLPQGRETVLGERGLRLSGGQRQRLAIARAILKDPSLLVLDEATSNLDAASERSVQQALDKLYAGRTALVIAHRLSTLQSAHRIVVLHQGEVMESGTHAELLARRGVYAGMHALQSLERPVETEAAS